MKPVVTETRVDKLFDFTGKVTLITGAGGVGAAFAKGYCRQGAKVILLDVFEKSCLALQAKLREEGLDADYFVADVTNKAEVDKVVREIADKYGRIDILLHTAGVTRNKRCYEFTAEDIEFVLDINLNGTIYMNQAVASVMKEQKYGKIVDIGSIGGLMSHMDCSMPYEASKAAVHQIVKTFANELSIYNINVNSIAPYFIRTPMVESQSQEYKDASYALAALGRWLEPEELLGAAYLLTSDAGNAITGQILAVDGGYSAMKSMYIMR
jgi:NAD(P)-dependent dehydrogenase (short-subunit alcohol dehydrogenase family)